MFTTNQIERGILKLMDNNITHKDDEEEEYDNSMAHLMNMFKSKRGKKKPKKKSNETKLEPTVEDLSMTCDLKQELCHKNFG